MANRACDRLGIPVPRVEEHLPRGSVKLFHTMVVALLEHGAPMTLDEIVERLRAAGVETRAGLRTSLLTSWRGRRPVYRNPDGTFALSLQSGALDWILLLTGLRALRPRVAPPPTTPPPAKASRSEDEPLTADEFRTLLKNLPSGMSELRVAAAALDAAGGPMTGQELDAFASSVLGEPRIGLARGSGYWRSPLVSVGPDGTLHLTADTETLRSLRHAVRRVTHAAEEREAREAEIKQHMAHYDAEEAARHTRDVEEALALRRAVVRALPDGAHPEAVGILDLKTREIRVFAPAPFEQIRTALDEYDLLAGLEVRHLLYTIGAEPDRWHVADLAPPQKTVRLNRAGRTLRLTPELVISGTLGASRPLGDQAKVRAYVAAGDRRRLARRVEADLKSLYALYQYGTLHRAVRLRWGFLDELLFVSWAHRGDAQVTEILKTAQSLGAQVDLVLRYAPGWKDPWARARRYLPLQWLGHWQGYYLQARAQDGMTAQIWLGEVQAIRIVQT